MMSPSMPKASPFAGRRAGISPLRLILSKFAAFAASAAIWLTPVTSVCLAIGEATRLKIVILSLRVARIASRLITSPMTAQHYTDVIIDVEMELIEEAAFRYALRRGTALHLTLNGVGDPWGPVRDVTRTASVSTLDPTSPINCMPHEHSHVPYADRGHYLEPIRGGMFNYLRDSGADAHNGRIVAGHTHSHFSDDRRPAPYRWIGQGVEKFISPLASAFDRRPRRFKAIHERADEIRQRDRPTIAEGVEPNPGPRSRRGGRGGKGPALRKIKGANAPAVRRRGARRGRANGPRGGGNQGSYIMRPTPVPRMGLMSQSLRNPGMMSGFERRRTMRNAPGYQKMELSGENVVVAGLSPPSTGATGEVLYTIQLNPILLGINRLAQAAGWFQRFDIETEFILDTGRAQNDAGSVGGWYNSEPSDSISSIPQADRLDNATLRPGWASYNVWKEPALMRWPMPPIMMAKSLDGNVVHQLYYTDIQSDRIEPRLTSKGTFNLMVSNQLGAATTGWLGNLILKYKVKLYMAQDDLPIPTVVKGGTMRASSGGACSAAIPLGVAPTVDYNTSSLSFKYDPNYLTNNFSNFGAPGTNSRWILAYQFTGTVITAGLNYTGFGCTLTTITNPSSINSGATVVTGWIIFNVLTTGTLSYVALSLTATTVTSGSFRICSIGNTLTKPRLPSFGTKYDRDYARSLDAEIEHVYSSDSPSLLYDGDEVKDNMEDEGGYSPPLIVVRENRRGVMRGNVPPRV